MLIEAITILISTIGLDFVDWPPLSLNLFRISLKVLGNLSQP
jgi:hypothetical protein